MSGAISDFPSKLLSLSSFIFFGTVGGDGFRCKSEEVGLEFGNFFGICFGFFSGF